VNLNDILNEAASCQPRTLSHGVGGCSGARLSWGFARLRGPGPARATARHDR
jgi:hypothetical protein